MCADRTVILNNEDDPLEHPGETIKTFLRAQGVPPAEETEVSLDLPSSEMGARVGKQGVAEPGGLPETDSIEATPPPSPSTRGALRFCDNDYVFEQLIGEGGQGQVWAALQVPLGRTVAVKRLSKHPENGDDFLKEVYTSAQLDHPNIVPIYDVGMLNGELGPTPMMAMKRVAGTPWKDHLAADRIMPNFRLEDFLQKHLPVFIQVLNAVDYAHSKKIIHRDLKPAQVMIGDYGEVYLLDWGLAICLDDGEHVRTRTGGVARVSTLKTATNPAGTPAYMAPEQAHFRTELLGLHTDIYLLGAMLYETLMGHPPHYSKNGKLRLSDVRNNVFEPLPPHAPPELAKLVGSCLESEPTLRPHSVRHLRDVVANYLTGAGRKQESAEMTAALHSVDPLTLDSYEALSHESHRLAQAANLWPENPELEFCRNLILSAYVTVALGRRDFLLAQLQAERVADDEWAARLLEEVEQSRQRAAAEVPYPRLFTPQRIATLVACWAFIVCALLGLTHMARTALHDEVHSKVQSLAAIAAQDVFADDMRSVAVERQIYTDAFQRTMQRLNFYRRSNEDIRYIYTLQPEFSSAPNHWRTLVDADPLDVDLDGDGTISAAETGSPPGALYEQGIPAMRQALEEGIPTSGYLDDDWGRFISGFAPVVDPFTGEVVAILGMDVKRDGVEEKFRAVIKAMIVVGLFLLALVTITCIAFFQARRALQRIDLLEKDLAAQNQQVRGKGLHL